MAKDPKDLDGTNTINPKGLVLRLECKYKGRWIKNTCMKVESVADGFAKARDWLRSGTPGSAKCVLKVANIPVARYCFKNATCYLVDPFTLEAKKNDKSATRVIFNSAEYNKVVQARDERGRRIQAKAAVADRARGEYLSLFLNTMWAAFHMLPRVDCSAVQELATMAKTDPRRVTSVIVTVKRDGEDYYNRKREQQGGTLTVRLPGSGDSSHVATLAVSVNEFSCPMSYFDGYLETVSTMDQLRSIASAVLESPEVMRLQEAYRVVEQEYRDEMRTPE